MESSCRDVPAPGVGAEGGACPIGFTGDPWKQVFRYELNLPTSCMPWHYTADIDECQVNSSVCHQVCTNSAGSYTCS